MKKLLFALLVLVMPVPVFAQSTPFSTFSINLDPVSLPGNKQTVAGTEGGTMLRFTPNNGIGLQTIFAPGDNFQYYSGRYDRHIPYLSNKLQNASPTLNGYKFDFGVTASAGVVRITGPASTQHYGFTGGGFVNYYVNNTWSLGAEVQYAKFPGLNNSTFTVALDPAVHF